MDSTKIVQTVSMLAEGFALNGLKPSWGPRGSGPLRMLYWSGRALGRMLYWSGRACGLVGWWAVPVLYTVQCLWAYGLVGQYSTVPVGLWAGTVPVGLWAGGPVQYSACGPVGWYRAWPSHGPVQGLAQPWASTVPVGLWAGSPWARVPGPWDP